jgi:hypothetical protein
MKDMGQVALTNPATGQKKSFTFDSCFDVDSIQSDVFEDSASSLVSAVQVCL